MGTARERKVDVGTAYGLPARSYKTHLVEVIWGTPMGELMRRFGSPSSFPQI